MKRLWLFAALFITTQALASDFVINNVLLPDFQTRELTPVNIEVADGKFKQIVDSSGSLVAFRCA